MKTLEWLISLLEDLNHKKDLDLNLQALQEFLNENPDRRDEILRAGHLLRAVNRATAERLRNANAEAKKIVNKARVQAQEIIQKAREEAMRLLDGGAAGSVDDIF